MVWKILREEAGLSQGQAAIAIGVDKSTVQKWDQNLANPAGIKTILRVCRAYGKTLEELAEAVDADSDAG